MTHTAGKKFSPYGTMLQQISSKTLLLKNVDNYLCNAFKKCVTSFSFIAWLKYIVYGSDTSDLTYILVLLDILIFMVTISPGT